MSTEQPAAIPIVRRQRGGQARLTDRQIQQLKPRAKPFKCADGNGLYLLINPTGSKLWRFKYSSWDGSERLAALGKYPDVTLQQARQARDEKRKQLSAGVDPVQHAKAQLLARRIAADNSFETVATRWWTVWKVGKSQQHAEQVMRRFKANVFPHIGHRPISEIDATELVQMLNAIQARDVVDLAKRAFQTSSQVFRFATANGLAKRNPAADIRPSDVLISRPKRNLARIDAVELPDLLRHIEGYKGGAATRLAIKLMALTFVRTTELIGAEWSEIHWDRAEWRIPEGRMKMKTMHIVPLSSQAINVLRTLHLISGAGTLIFPGERDHQKPMSNNTILKALEIMGYKGRMTGHGFRGLASTVLHEMDFEHQHIELQLAHQERNQVSAAYNHATYLKQRARMMQAWADYLDACTTSPKAMYQPAAHAKPPPAAALENLAPEE
ncbi:MAG: phage integrase [Nitrospira sp.]|jgi:integrase|nr:phage integrase [Nitrospira sp.]